MAVGPVTLNGMIPRTQDFSTIKQQEDNKSGMEQQYLQAHMKANKERQIHQVNHADDAGEHKKKYDAKEKGSNEYKGQQNKKKKEEKKQPEKGTYVRPSGGFDMKA